MGRHITILAWLYSALAGLSLGWAGIEQPRPAQQQTPAGPGLPCPGWAFSAPSPARLGHPPSSPTWAAALARLGRSSIPRLGRSALSRLGRDHRLGWAGSSSSRPGRPSPVRPPAGPASPEGLLFLQCPDGLAPAAPRLGRIRRIRPGRDFLPRPPFVFPAGPV
jgi:hypothetical protein